MEKEYSDRNLAEGIKIQYTEGVQLLQKLFHMFSLTVILVRSFVSLERTFNIIDRHNIATSVPSEEPEIYV